MTAGGSALASRLVQTMQLLVQVHLYNCTIGQSHQQKCTTGRTHLYIVTEQLDCTLSIHRRALCSVRDSGIHIHHQPLAVPVVSPFASTALPALSGSGASHQQATSLSVQHHVLL